MNFCKGMNNCINWSYLTLDELSCCLFDKLDGNIFWISNTWNQVSHYLATCARYCILPN